ncbi:MAG: fumarate hydratase [Candidatus Saganbacteria bacterium]|nr:fumarate hydratase [Candidatus Saganbacteria bacterium]
MRKISASTIIYSVRKLCMEACQDLDPQILAAIKDAFKKEKSATGRQILDEIIRNAKVAQDDKLPLCQDTGFAVFFVELGEKASVIGNLSDAIKEGVVSGYKHLRKSIVAHPFQRKNTFDNAPPIIHINIVPGDKLKIGFLPKGGGAENCSFQKMFLPIATKEEVINYIVDNIKLKAAKACPPIIVGVGIGGTFDYSAYLAKKALIRPINSPSRDSSIAAMEKDLLKRINKLGIGPMGMGGSTTALAVHIEHYPCHIASLPVAVNLECHAHRYKEVVV